MERIKNCRACDSNDLVMVLDLGSTPLANSLIGDEELLEEEFVAPLELLFCQSCSLVQISCTIAPEKLFRNYAYFSSFSETMLEHAKALSSRVMQERQLNEDSLVVEIASNDGYLLKNYNYAGVKTLGVEPALNIAEVARANGIETIAEFFDDELAKKIVASKGQADIVHAHNVMAHVPEINRILHGLGTILKDNGVAIVEVPYAVKMVENLEFDTIYHEHVFYFSVTAINNLLARNALILSHLEQDKIHGGSLRLFITKTGGKSAAVQALLENEANHGYASVEGYNTFAGRVNDLKAKLVKLVNELKQNKKKLAVYGAAAKGSTLLNFCGLGSPVFDFVVDRSTAKQGFYMPGVKLPIYSPKKLLEEMPDYVLLLTWNFADEIFRQQAEYIKMGGRFILPLPEPKILQPDNEPIYA